MPYIILKEPSCFIEHPAHITRDLMGPCVEWIPDPTRVQENKNKEAG